MGKKSEKIQIVYKKLSDLKECGYNPKNAKPKELEQIRQSVQTFGIVDPFVVNMFEGRENVIINGHQRKLVYQELGITEVPCVEVSLPLEEEKELNIRLSKNVVGIDAAMLAINFQKELLEKVGFSQDELSMFKSDYEKQFNAVTNEDVPYPLVPKFSEKYDAVIIISKNVTDTAFLETVLQIGKAQSYKNSRTGKAMIIDVEHLRKALGK
jgi:hypothetical protein